MRENVGSRHVEFVNVPGKLPLPVRNHGFRYFWAVILFCATYSLTVLSLLSWLTFKLSEHLVGFESNSAESH